MVTSRSITLLQAMPATSMPRWQLETRLHQREGNSIALSNERETSLIPLSAAPHFGTIRRHLDARQKMLSREAPETTRSVGLVRRMLRVRFRRMSALHRDTLSTVKDEDRSRFAPHSAQLSNSGKRIDPFPARQPTLTLTALNGPQCIRFSRASETTGCPSFAD
jgi:hypothetical protein